MAITVGICWDLCQELTLLEASELVKAIEVLRGHGSSDQFRMYTDDESQYIVYDINNNVYSINYIYIYILYRGVSLNDVESGKQVASHLQILPVVWCALQVLWVYGGCTVQERQETFDVDASASAGAVARLWHFYRLGRQPYRLAFGLRLCAPCSIYFMQIYIYIYVSYADT